MKRRIRGQCYYCGEPARMVCRSCADLTDIPEPKPSADARAEAYRQGVRDEFRRNGGAAGIPSKVGRRAASGAVASRSDKPRRPDIPEAAA